MGKIQLLERICEGKVFASNRFFARKFEVAEATIKRILSESGFEKQEEYELEDSKAARIGQLKTSTFGLIILAECSVSI